MLIWNGTEYKDMCPLAEHRAVGLRQVMGDTFLAALRAFLADPHRHYARPQDRMELEAYPLEMTPKAPRERIWVPLPRRFTKSLVDWLGTRFDEYQRFGELIPHEREGIIGKIWSWHNRGGAYIFR